MNLKVYEVAYGETVTATGSVAGRVVTYDITFSDQGVQGPVGPSGPQGIQGLPGDFVVNFRVVSAAETLVSKAKIAANTAAGALTLTLPANPTNGDVIDFYDYAETFDTNNLTIARNGRKIEGLDENLVCNVKGAYFSLVYSGTTRGWQVLPSFGTSGGGGETVLTTAGDTLYRGVGVNQRLPIGTTGQVLKVSAQGLPTWANESGAVTSVNGATGAVTVAAATHAVEHEFDGADPLQAKAALVTTDVAALNGVYFWDGTTTSGRPNFYKTGTRKNTKIVYNAATLQWNLVRNLTVEAVGVDGPSTVPWGNTWEEFVTPTSVEVTQLPLETMVQKLAETGAAATATTSEDGLMSAADKTKLNGIAANATANTASSATPSALGTAASGSSSDYARADHVHSAEVSDSAFRVLGSTDATKKVAIEVDTNVPANTTVTLTAPSASGTLALAGAAPAAHTHDLNDLTRTGVMAGDIIVRNDNNNGWDVTTGTAWAGLNISAADIGAASGDHTHGNITNGGLVGTTSGLPLKTGTGGIVEAGSFGTSAGTFAEGNDSRITGAAQKSANLSDLASASTARTNLGLGTAATSATGDFAAASHTHTASAISDSTTAGRALLTAADAAAQRTSLGLAAIATSGSASDLASGTVPTARLGSGSASATTFLAGDQSWKAVSGVIIGSVDNAILRADTPNSTSQSSDINIEDATTSTENNVQISNQHSGQTNSSLVLTPKGTGAFILGPRPTGAASTGNARGTNAVDLQTLRGAATRVASGQESVICGGSENTASGLRSAVLGGSSNTASGERSVVLGGTGNSATGLQCIVSGQSNSVSATYSSIIGGFVNTCASGSYMSFIAGQGNTTSAKVTVALGEYALADRNGTFAWGGGRFAANGDAQFVRAILRRKVSTEAATELLTDVDGTTGRFSIASGKTVAALVHIVAATSGGEFACQYIRECVIRNRGGTTALRGSVQTVGTDTEDFAACDVTISADDTNDALKIEFAGTAPVTGCTGTASTDRINKVAHGFNNNDDIIFSSLTGGAGLTLNTVTYWVINANADDFQVSATRGGAAVNITTDYSDMTATRLFRVVALVDAVEVGHGT